MVDMGSGKQVAAAQRNAEEESKCTLAHATSQPLRRVAATALDSALLLIQDYATPIHALVCINIIVVIFLCSFV